MEMTRIPIALVLTAALGLTACATGTSSTPAATELREVTLLLGYRPDVQFAPFYVAQQNGLYAEAGLEVTIEHRQAPDVQRLVASGEAEFGVADATDVMIARTTGIPVRYASTLYRSFPVAVIGPAESVPAEPAGLEGASIGTPGRFGSSWHALLALLDAGGLDEADVEIREYPQFNQADGLANGDVELITGFRNNDALRVEDRVGSVGVLSVDDVAPLPGPGIIVADALVDEDPELVRAFVAATAEAQAAVIADPEVGYTAAAAEVPAVAEDPALSRAVLEATAELWEGDGFDGGAIDRDLWNTGYETMRRLGFIDGSVPVEDMIWDDAR
jgi:NitT/TauT family transport system substrate-binding protein